jgi:hypothetical protein
MDPITLIAGGTALASLATGLIKKYREKKLDEQGNRFEITVVGATGAKMTASSPSPKQAKQTASVLIEQLAKDETERQRTVAK